MHESGNFYFSQVEPNKSCLLTIRDIILSQDPNVTETSKYGMPCFCYKKKMFCYLWIDKKTDAPYVLFVEGQHLNHSKLEIGSRKRMKILPINPNEDLPINVITELLNQALDLYKNGIINIK